jgi:hypothetical protein
MTTNPELSTEDLARPGGVRQQDQPAGRAGREDDDRTVAIQGGPGDPATGGVGDRPGDPPGGSNPEGMSGAGATMTTGSTDAMTAGSGESTNARPADTVADGARDRAADDVQNGAADDARDRAADGVQGGAPDRTEGDRTGDGADDRPASGVPTQAGSEDAGADMALLDPTDGQRFRQRWSDVQARFVDDPQEAVQSADGLVAELMQSLATGFSEHKGRLESQWQSGDQPDTEELRQALRRYRSFFDRLLST